MNKIPSFRHMGGKARLRNKLIDLFPNKGNIYFEPFVGKGNIFFKAKLQLKYNKWILNDLDISFLKALLSINPHDLPKIITKEDFNYWKNKNNFISKVIEPRITFAGKGYKYGYSGSSGNHVGYTYKNYKKVCEIAINILSTTTTLQEKNWEDINWNEFTKFDFVYLDPPYINTKANYPNIDHEKLIYILNGSCFKWALSGYDNELYFNALSYSKKYEFFRNSEIKSSQKREYCKIKECLWINY